MIAPAHWAGAAAVDGAKEQRDEALSLDRQICFPLYAASRLLTRVYQPILGPLGITYPQYIVLLVLWEVAPCTVSQVGERVLLNTNTITPLLKRLEQLGLVERLRRTTDERVVEVHLTAAGLGLKAHCNCFPSRLLESTQFPLEKAAALKQLLDELVLTLRSGSENQTVT